MAISYNAGSNLITLTGSGASPAGGTSWGNAYTMDDVLAQCGAVTTKQGANAYDVSARMLFQSGVYFVSESEFVELKPNPINPTYAIDADAGSHIRIGNYNSDDDYSYNGAFWRIYMNACTGNRLDRFDGELLVYGSNLWSDGARFNDSYNFWGTTRIYDTEVEGNAYISGEDIELKRVTWKGKGAATDGYDMLLASGYDFPWSGIKVMNSKKGIFMSSTVSSDIDLYDVVIVDSINYDYYESGNRLMRFINAVFDRNKVYVPSGKQGLQECYTFNVKVTDSNGNGLVGATVSLKDTDGNNAFPPEETIAGGVLTADKIVRVWWKGYDNAAGIKDYNPFTLKVVYCAEETEYVITIDHKMSEDIVLLPQSTASYDNIMAGITALQTDVTSLTDEAFGKWVINSATNTLTLYKEDDSVLKTFDLTTAPDVIPTYIERNPQP